MKEHVKLPPGHQTCEDAPRTYISDYSVQRVDQDKVKGGRGGGGQADLQNKDEDIKRRSFHIQDAHIFQNTHLKVLVVVRIYAETGDETVHHELHVGVLAARPPPEGFGWVEQQSLVGQGSYQVVKKQFSGPDSTGSWRE